MTTTPLFPMGGTSSVHCGSESKHRLTADLFTRYRHEALLFGADILVIGGGWYAN